MMNQFRLIATGIVLLLVSCGFSPSAFSGWDDGFWPLDSGRSSRQSSFDSAHELTALEGFLKDSADVRSVEVILLDDETVVAYVATSRDSDSFLFPSRDLLLLIEVLEDAGLDLAAPSESEEALVGMVLIWP